MSAPLDWYLVAPLPDGAWTPPFPGPNTMVFMVAAADSDNAAQAAHDLGFPKVATIVCEVHEQAQPKES